MQTIRFLCALALACALPGASLAAAQKDLHYGPDAAQLADVYTPDAASAPPGGAPILVMVHGGSWLYGDKAEPVVIDHKRERWLPLGFVVVSVNTRLLPAARPEAQAEDLGLAVAWIQRQAPAWKADPNRILIMGHSSGGHLVALLAADNAMRQRTGAHPWLASVILDGAAFDLPEIMSQEHASFYEDAFGTDPARWLPASPAEHLSGPNPPTLLVCSTLRRFSCQRTQEYADRLTAQGGQAQVVPVARDHGQINSDVGADNAETRAIMDFMDAQLRR